MSPLKPEVATPSKDDRYDLMGEAALAYRVVKVAGRAVWSKIYS